MKSTDSNQKITLVCLDMAGTTVQDDGAVEQAFLSALDTVDVGHDDPRRKEMLDYVNETMGTSKIEVFKALFPDDADKPFAANSAFEVAYAEAVALGKIEAIPGAQETMAALRKSGVKVALMTGFSALTRDALVDALSWQQVADVLLCPQDAGRGRPYPDMILAAILRLQIDDVASVAVAGDTALNRTVLRDGFATESVDGQLVSTLMGDYVEPDVGTLRVRMLPNFWCHASCDHAVSTRLRPAGIDKTIASVTWLVDKAALEGRDYELEQLMPFWELTSEQDWQICERQQRGISSSAYLPGPLSSTREANVDSWLTWYTQSLLSALSVTSP